jgi:ActR/RegA family two-component response regulator
MIDGNYLSVGIAAVMAAFVIYDRVFGNGKRSASLVTMQELSDLRREVFLKHDTSEGNIGTAVQAIKDTVHAMQLEAATFRAVSAETYMRRDSYYKAMGELKSDVNVAFEKIDKRLERMENTIAENQRANSKH